MSLPVTETAKHFGTEFLVSMSFEIYFIKTKSVYYSNLNLIAKTALHRKEKFKY